MKSEIMLARKEEDAPPSGLPWINQVFIATRRGKISWDDMDMPLPVVRVWLWRAGFKNIIMSKSDFEWIKEESLNILKSHSDEKFEDDLDKLYDHYEEVQREYENTPPVILK